MFHTCFLRGSVQQVGEVNVKTHYPFHSVTHGDITIASEVIIRRRQNSPTDDLNGT
jgi:hypothetical protein